VQQLEIGREAAKWPRDQPLTPSLHPIYDAHLFAYRRISGGDGTLEVDDWCRGIKRYREETTTDIPYPLFHLKYVT
jgi:hypothetical protein